MADVSSTPPATDSEMGDRIVGIDLGTSYSALAVLDEDGQPRVIDNSNQSPLTAAVVLLGDAAQAAGEPDAAALAQGPPDRGGSGQERSERFAEDPGLRSRWWHLRCDVG